MGSWHKIIANVLQSRMPGAQCVFATFYSQEAESAALVCQSLGAACEIRENPYYTGQSKSIVGTFFRYAVILSRTSVEKSNLPPVVSAVASLPRPQLGSERSHIFHPLLRK